MGIPIIIYQRDNFASVIPPCFSEVILYQGLCLYIPAGTSPVELFAYGFLVRYFCKLLFKVFNDT